jgi:hypothetical protein
MRLNRFPKLFFLLIFSIIILLIVYFRWKYSSPFARSWDEVDFALALDRFDLGAMQPHFPGYPYFILGGMFMQKLISNPIEALAKFNVVMSMLAIIPMYFIAKYYFSYIESFIIAVSIQSLTYMWVISSSPISEGAAIAILWWYIWSLQLATRKSAIGYKLLPFLIFGLLMGTRLSFLPFGIGLLMVAFDDWIKNKKILRLLLLFLVGVGTQLIWIFGLISSEGSINGFIELAKSFILGHFNDWGGAVTAINMPLWERFIILFFHNFFWVGLFGESILVMLIIVILLIILTIQYLKVRTWSLDRFHNWLLILTIFYFFWALLAQNIDKPRHISPLVGLASYMLYYLLFKWLNKIRAIACMSIIVFIQIFEGIDIIKKQVNETPAVYQLVNSLKGVEGDFTVYTWEETRVMEYLNVPFQHKRIYTYKFFLDEIRNKEHQRIFLTGRILKGFEQQAGDLRDKVVKIGQFHSDPFFDPIYSDITLYEWIDK